jgi:hypothetical protein
MLTVGMVSGLGGGKVGLAPVWFLVGKVALAPQPASASSTAIATNPDSKRNVPRRACVALSCPAWTRSSFIGVRHKPLAVNEA